MTNHDTATTDLTAQKALAVDRLALGATITDAAQDAGVARQTVSGWYNHDSDFQAAVNARRQEIWTNSADRLRAMLPKALAILEGELDQGHVNTAMAVLKAAGIYGAPARIGSTDSVELALAELRNV